jgi:hypothetical protein
MHIISTRYTNNTSYIPYPVTRARTSHIVLAGTAGQSTMQGPLLNGNLRFLAPSCPPTASSSTPMQGRAPSHLIFSIAGTVCFVSLGGGVVLSHCGSIWPSCVGGDSDETINLEAPAHAAQLGVSDVLAPFPSLVDDASTTRKPNVKQTRRAVLACVPVHARCKPSIQLAH